MPVEFANPQFLWLLGYIPVLVLWYVIQHNKQQPALQFSSNAALGRREIFSKVNLRHSLFTFRLIAYSALTIALSRPQVSFTEKTIATEGIDIMLTLDVSGSMLTKDFHPDRLEAAKEVADTFISHRPNDRIGLVLFAAEAYTGCPITIDHDALKKILSGIKPSSMSDGTAIGMGLGTALNHLQDSKGKTKIVILMTDGENNAGTVQPLVSARLAKTLGIRVYTIGLNVNNKIPGSSPTEQTATADNPGATTEGEILLEQIAEITNGKYFRATDEKSLAAIYKIIDQFEKTKVDVTSFTRYEERFYLFAFIAAIAVFLEVLLRYTLFKTVL